MLTLHVSVALVRNVRLTAPRLLENWPIWGVTERVYIDHMIYTMVVHRLLSTLIIGIKFGLIAVKPVNAAQCSTFL